MGFNHKKCSGPGAVPPKPTPRPTPRPTRRPTPRPTPKPTNKWYCAVKKRGGVVYRGHSLGSAQRSLGRAGWGTSQAIIPMTDRNSGDPHRLSKSWSVGNMWWWNWPDIHGMQATCRAQQAPVRGAKNYLMHNTNMQFRNMYGSGTYMDVCGHANCGGGYNVVTNIRKDRANVRTAHWSFRKDGHTSAHCVRYGTQVHIYSSYGGNAGRFLDVCGHSGCGGGYRVSTTHRNNRDGATGTWVVESAEGKSGCIEKGARVHVKNLYQGGHTYLDVCGHDRCGHGRTE